MSNKTIDAINKTYKVLRNWSAVAKWFGIYEHKQWIRYARGEAAIPERIALLVMRTGTPVMASSNDTILKPSTKKRAPRSRIDITNLTPHQQNYLKVMVKNYRRVNTPKGENYR